MIEDKKLYIKFRCYLIQTTAIGHQAFNMFSPNPVTVSGAVSGAMKGIAGKNFGWDRIVDFLSEFPHPLKRIAIFESQELNATAVYKEGYVNVPADDLLLKHFIRNLVFKLMCIDVHMTLLEYGIKNCADGHFNEQQKNDSDMNNKTVVIPLSDPWGDIDQIRLNAVCGTGMAKGKTYIKVNLYSGSVLKTEAGGWQIVNGKLATMDYKTPDEGTPGHELKKIIDLFFMENSKELKKLSI